jgi:hypothetical protein
MKQHLRAIGFTITTALLMTGAGCDDKKPDAVAPTATPTAVPAKPAEAAAPSKDAALLGTWEAKQGEPGKPGAFYVRMTLDLRPDKTVAYAMENTDPQNPGGKPMEKKAQGSWSAKGDEVTVTLEKSLTGGEIPPAQKQMNLRLATDAKGPHLSMPDGPRFDRAKP